MTTPEDCPCPVCEHPGRLMHLLSAVFDQSDYYQCLECRHIWTVPKGECEPADAVSLGS